VQNVRIWQPVLGWAPRSSKTPSSTRTREAVVVAVRPRKGAQRRCGRWGDGFAVYPMPMFARLAMSDLQASVAWYTEALGFGVVFVGPEIDGRPLMAHLRRRRYQDLLLVPATDPQPTARGLTIPSAPTARSTASVSGFGESQRWARRGRGAGSDALEHARARRDRPRRLCPGLHGASSRRPGFRAGAGEHSSGVGG